MKTKILRKDEVRRAALTTLNELADLVCSTLGPGGKPVILEQLGSKPDGTPKDPLITKDGVTVAEHVDFRDPLKNTLAKTIIQVAKNTVNVGGDGTTSATLLANAIYTAGFKYLEQGANSIQLFNDLKNAKDNIIKQLNEIAIPIQKDSEVKDVARISANGDEEIAEIVFKAITAVGEDGYVSLEEGYTRDTFLNIVDGAVYKQGWRGFGPHGSLLISDASRNICEMEKPAVLLYADKLDSVHDLADFINKVMARDPNTGMLHKIIPLFIIANDYSDDVKNFIVQNRVQQKLPLAAIKSPFDGSPNARTEMLRDLASLLGGTVAARGILELKDIQDKHLGCADRVEIGAEETAIFSGHGSEEEVMSRISDLKKYMETGNLHPFDKENVRLRVGKLSGGIAIINVGGDSELEMKERKDRIEDALCAARAAIQEGIVTGGGLTLYQLAKQLNPKNLAEQILKETLTAPIKQLITNVGEDPAAVLKEMELLYSDAQIGYDARNKTFVNLLEAGIVDPVKVTKAALENAVSIAGLLLTSGGAVVSDQETKDGMPNPLAGLMGMG